MRLRNARSIALGLWLAACGASPHEEATVPPITIPQSDATDRVTFVGASNGFGLDVWRQIRGEHAGENLAIAPASLATALTMTYGGARGATRTAMADAMHLGALSEDAMPDRAMVAAGALVSSWNDPARTSYELSVASRLFGNAGFAFDPTYVAATRDVFDAELERLDFESAEPSRRTINEWVSGQTHARIPELMPPGSIDATTRLVLVNAVYFHGRWARPFDPAATRDDVFHAPSGDVNVPTMHAEGGDYGEDDGVQLLELPYAGDELSMLFVVPTRVDGLAEIEEHLDAAKVSAWASGLHHDRDLEISVPRFRIETPAMSLGAALSALGMGVAFTDAADFSGMTEGHVASLAISDVFHRVFVELNEEGTEAAGATGVGMVLTSARIGEPPHVTIDRPFLFFLRERSTGAVLFAGRVIDPR